MMMAIDNLWGTGGRPARVVGIVLLLIHLQCGEVGCLHDGIFGYVSFQETGEWNRAYTQTCRGKSQDGFREPRYLQYPDTMRPAWEAKTPVPIYTKDVIRKDHDNLTLHIFNNPGVREGYSLSYGFQRDKECIHGQDANCIIQRTFGTVRALVLNAERFAKGQDLNYIKDHFLTEKVEEHVTIINGGSPYERKFYEAVFLGGYVPKALQGRGKSSHVIDGKSYPLEIYLYFVDETVPSMSLATILVVLVEESEKENPFIKPIVSTVRDKLYEQERRLLIKSDKLYRTERQFHNQGPSFKYDMFGKGKKKSEEKIRQEMLSASASQEEDLTGHLEIYEKMQALESQLLFLDEDLKNAKDVFADINDMHEGFTDIGENKFYPLDNFELILIFTLILNMAPQKDRAQVYGADYFRGKLDHKKVEDTVTYEDWNLIYPLSLLDFTRAKFHERVYLLDEYIQDFTALTPTLNQSERNTFAELHRSQLKNMTFWTTRHAQKYINWHVLNRNVTYMKRISQAQKYRHVKEYQDLTDERKLINEMIYDHFFGHDSIHQRANQWHTAFKTSPSVNVPNFTNTEPVEEKKRSVMDTLLGYLDLGIWKDDYQGFINDTVDAINELAKVNNFRDVQDMRDVLHHHNFGYKNLDMRGRRNYVHDAFFSSSLPYQEKRKGFLDLANMEVKEDSKEEVKTSPLKVAVNQSFQVSWLLPPNGGYYYYSGSSPVPPCHRAQNVIVFKKPINMSRYQIEMLTKVPISFEKRWDIVHTTPVLHDTHFTVQLLPSRSQAVRYEEVTVPVYHQPRNHLFLGHDGVHKNAVEEHENRVLQAKAKEQLNAGSKPGTYGLVGLIGIALGLVTGFACQRY